MARRKGQTGRKVGKLLVVGAIGLGGYAAWKAGLFTRLWAAMQGAGGSENGNGQTNGNGSSGTSTSWLDSLFAAIAGLFGGGSSNGSTSVDVNVPQSLIDALTGYSGQSSGITLPDWLAGVPAGGATIASSQIPVALAQALVPLIIGLSPAVPELVHDVNVALPGPNTGIEKGNMTLMTARGPFIWNPTTRTCSNLAGQTITCPAASQIVGIEQHTLDWYRQIQEGSA